MIINYVEVNAICIIFLLLLHSQFRNMNTTSSNQRVLVLLIWSTVVMCASDMMAGVLRGMLFPGARILLELSNGLYFEVLVIISYLWCVYAHTRLAPNGLVSRRALSLSALPAIAFTVIVLLNPITHFLFSIDAQNLYQRGVGVYLHWVVVWGYFLVPSVKALLAYLKETSAIKKQEIAPILLFGVAPFIASMIQMFFYGVTTTQVGITISILVICFKSQESQILTDALTGINNRRAMTSFVENHIQHNKDAVCTLIMIDVNRFKQINDKYGHMVGDLVLKRIAISLKTACKSVSNHVHLSRFGGDEFVILAIDCDKSEVELLLKAISDGMKKETTTPGIPCEVTVSIGCTQGKCAGEKDFKELLNQADLAMYKAKAGTTQR